MFDLADKPRLWIPVQWPGLKAGEDDVAVAVTNEIEMYVELVDRDEFRETFGLDEFGVVVAKKPDAEIIARLASDWRGVRNGKTPVPFGPEGVGRMVKVPGFAMGFGEAYNDAINGKVKAREGNSDGSPPDGLAGDQAGKTTAAAT